MLKAWDNDNKSWLNSFFVRNDGEVLVPIHIIDNTNLISVKAVNATLCRSTFLTDMAGIIIYEDDIIKVNNDIFKVVFANCTFKLIRIADYSCIDLQFFKHSKSEIIGNIFEHEHLLKGN